jgi:hypothetical protein
MQGVVLSFPIISFFLSAGFVFKEILGATRQEWTMDVLHPRRKGSFGCLPGEAGATNKDTKYIKLPASFQLDTKKIGEQDERDEERG